MQLFFTISHFLVHGSWLDVFIINSSDKVRSFRKSEVPFVAGHDLLEMSYRFESPPNHVRTIVRRSYGRLNDSVFLDVLAVCSMSRMRYAISSLARRALFVRGNRLLLGITSWRHRFRAE